MRDIEIIDGVKSLEVAKQLMQKYGTVKDMIDLPEITNKETIDIPNQLWHQDGLQTEHQPKYQALWCKLAADKCPTTQYVSSRISKELGDKYYGLKCTFNFKKPIDEGRFYKFDTRLDQRLYLRRIYKGEKDIIGKDEDGYFTRWNEMAVLDLDIYKELRKAVLSNEVHEVKWKTNRLVIANNFATLHRRTPFTYPDGERIIFRAYVM
jgi:hypothetical protein|tara:strand:- start:2817 stop:3440 length:624 start_codon:yes stop_codon:yes gene_type:complete